MFAKRIGLGCSATRTGEWTTELEELDPKTRGGGNIIPHFGNRLCDDPNTLEGFVGCIRMPMLSRQTK